MRDHSSPNPLESNLEITYSVLQSGIWGGVALALGWTLGSCGSPPVDSFESAQQAIDQSLLPRINLRQAYVSDSVASRYTLDDITEPLPNIDDFPLYAAQPSPDPDTLTLEIFSSSEKANVGTQNERWLVEVAEDFNQQQITLDSGELIQISIRKIASGTAARLLSAQTVQPTGYSPSNDLWVQMIESAGVETIPVVPRLVPNTAGWVVQSEIYQDLEAEGEVTFEALLDQILAGSVAVGYPNPYASSTSLNLLYTLFWGAAGYDDPTDQLTVADLQSPQVNSVFNAFQQQVLITTNTTLDLQEIFIRDPEKLQAFPLEYQNYQTLVTLPGFETVEFIPFGIPHNNPLVGFQWNSDREQEALETFGDYVSSPEAQDLAEEQGFVETPYLAAEAYPPIPNGEVLTAAQTYWKGQKDAGRTVYMMIVIDVSGSMEGQPLRAVQEGLRIASKEINSGNHVGLIAFNTAPTALVPLAPFDTLQHQRLLAAIDSLRADGGTAMYDGMIVALDRLMEQVETDPNGRFYLLVLSDGQSNEGFGFDRVQEILEYSNVRVYPIAYGDVNMEEMQAIAALRESTVQVGTPENVQSLLKGLLQTNL